MLRERDSMLKRETSIEMRRRRYTRVMDGVDEERGDVTEGEERVGGEGGNSGV